MGGDLDKDDFGLLGNEGACDAGRDGVRALVWRDVAVAAAWCRMASWRSSSILLGLIVDLLRLPSRGSCVEALLDDLLVC